MSEKMSEKKLLLNAWAEINFWLRNQRKISLLMIYILNDEFINFGANCIMGSQKGAKT